MDHTLTGQILSTVAGKVGEHISVSVVQIKVEEKSENSDCAVSNCALFKISLRSKEAPEYI